MRNKFAIDAKTIDSTRDNPKDLILSSNTNK